MAASKQFKFVTGAEYYAESGGSDKAGNPYVYFMGNLDYDDAQKEYEINPSVAELVVRVQQNGKDTGKLRMVKAYYVRSGWAKGKYIEAETGKEAPPVQNLGAKWGAGFGSSAKGFEYGPDQSGVLKATSLKVYSAPYTDSSVVKTIKKGQTVTDAQSVSGGSLSGDLAWAYSKSLGGFFLWANNSGSFWGPVAEKKAAPKKSATIAPKEPTIADSAPPPPPESSNVGLMIGVGLVAVVAAYFIFGRK